MIPVDVPTVTENHTRDFVMRTAALISLATSVPPHTFLQKDVLAAAWDHLRQPLF
jgi:hypothetical protein